MALRPKIIACGNSIASFALVVALKKLFNKGVMRRENLYLVLCTNSTGAYE
ncbi:hypothetical protein PIB30_087166 [Stylosanthes scabra]|uniref:Uncharacterized protein n=1 Tax=Stylosanthes scabra TaxID=79078 RepID=A0ABU6ZS31_9FABA|nr:hypothetical protein [Stylosanthes scabra]